MRETVSCERKLSARAPGWARECSRSSVRLAPRMESRKVGQGGQGDRRPEGNGCKVGKMGLRDLVSVANADG